MTELTQNERSFVQAMKKGRDHEWRGFKLLIERRRDDLEKFLDVLISEGFFEPARNPAPAPADDEGRVHVPYWPPLDYLTACARQAADRKDHDLGDKVMDVVRNVTGGTDGGIQDNFRTAWKFAEIIGLLPNAVVKIADVDLVERWLGTSFSGALVVGALGEGAMRKFLASDDPGDWGKAAKIMRHCTAVRWIDEYGGRKPVPVADEDSSCRLIDRHACNLVRRTPAKTAALFEERIREVFGRGGERSDRLRPAVENHGQNRNGPRFDDGLVDALRDVLQIWCDTDGAGAKDRVRRLLKSDVQMLRRIGIHVLNRRWPLLGSLYPALVDPGLFQQGQIHELHVLLKERFESFDDGEKSRTFDAIRRMAPPAGEDAERYEYRWLSAMSGTGYEPVATRLSELRSARAAVSEHPDFNFYVSGATFGTGDASRYRLRELVVFAEDGSLVRRLNAFGSADDPRGPGVDALADVLSQAVGASPETFLEILREFIDVSAPYQRGVISGFKAFRERSKERPTAFDWDRGWRDVVGFVDAVTKRPEFWNDGDESRKFGARDAIVCAAVDFLDAGTSDDAHACPEPVMPNALKIIRRFLENVDSAAGADDQEPMMSALNTARGRSIGALFKHALECCRTSDRCSGSHDGAWTRLQPIFDDELRKCGDANYEFSTLAGYHLVNLDYMSADWLRANVTRIFSTEAESNFSCAVAGLAYSESTRRTYALLKDAGVIEQALKRNPRGRETRKKLIERMVKAYLWTEEKRGSPRMRRPFEQDAVDDLLDAVNFFWMIRGEDLSSAQRGLIVDYWEDCVRWASGRSRGASALLDALGRLAWVLETIDARNLELLLASAPHVQRHFGSYILLEQLERLVKGSPSAVGRVLEALIDAGVSVYDDDRNRLKSLILALNERGQRKMALDCCDKLVAQPGMSELYRQLTVSIPSTAA